MNKMEEKIIREFLIDTILIMRKTREEVRSKYPELFGIEPEKKPSILKHLFHWFCRPFEFSEWDI